MKDKLIVGEDMICPVTKKHCDDECCPVGAECNLGGKDICEPEQIKLGLSPTCVVTGKNNNLTMHAFRNDKGEMIGWVFLNEDVLKKIKEFNITVKTEWKTETKTQPIIGYCKSRIDNL